MGRGQSPDPSLCRAHGGTGRVFTCSKCWPSDQGRERSSLVCPSCMTNMLHVPGEPHYRCDRCGQTWECVQDDATAR